MRRFLIANTAWEATFAGMRTFVVLYIIDGLDQPLYVSSVVLAVVAAGYVVAAVVARACSATAFGLGNVILGASWSSTGSGSCRRVRPDTGTGGTTG